MTSDDRRDVDVTVELPAEPEAVWKALADADELTRWFPLEARVDPGEGGDWWIGWPPSPWQFSCEIERWEPGRRLRLVERRDDSKAEGHVLAIDFRLEPADAGTRLTVVHSGFGRGEEWDDEYESVGRGWRYELRCLGHYLDRHRGRDRATAWLMQSTDLTGEAAFARLTGADGFEPDPAMLALARGDRVRLCTPDGDSHAATVMAATPHQELAGILDDPDGAILRLMAEHGYAVISYHVWGPAGPPAVREFKSRWSDRLADLVS